MRPMLLLLASLSAYLATAYADVNAPPLSARGTGTIRQVTVSATTVPRYERLELTVDLSASYDNPYDPDQVDLTTTFTAPSGKTAAAAGFFYQGYRRATLDPDSPILARDGEPSWRVRFAPTEVGPYRCVVRLHNQFAGETHEAASAPLAFRCVPSASPGFIRVADPTAGPRAGAASSPTADRRYFAFDSGAPFYPVGQNTQNDWIDYRHTRILAEAGANCARSWLFCHWTWLEWSPMTPTWAGPGHWIRGYGGAGIYNQGLAWIADEYLQRCERDGIRLMLCIGAAHEVNAGDDVGRWAGNPYNRANGGFLDKPEEYWSNPRARQLARNRLRYIAARYGHSTAVWAWEFWNELGDAGPDVTAWHREMGDYLRSVDPNRHLQTTSTWQPEPDRLAPIWRLPEIDFTQSHIYAPSPALTPIVTTYLRLYGKPHVVGEGGGLPASPGGGDTAGQPCTVDPEGIDFHNSLWLPMMTGAAGGTLSWHWRQRIEPGGLSPQYGALARFLDNAPPGRLRPATVDVQPGATTEATGHFSPGVVVPLGAAWGSRAPADHFVLQPDGTIEHPEQLTRGLFGKWREQWRRPPTFVVHYLAAGRFIVHVGDMSHGVLTVALDGREVLREGSMDITRKTLDRDFGIDVPAGTHEIHLDNDGGDWIEAQYYVFTNVCDSARCSDLEAHALRTDSGALLWFRNRLDEWVFRAAGVPLTRTGPATVVVPELRNGAYQVEWWDTYRGVATGRVTAKADGAGLRIVVPSLERDVACLVRRASADDLR